MKILETFKRIDDRLLKKSPVLWVLGVHIYIPLVLVTSFILFLIGAAYSLVPLPMWSDFKDFYATLNLVMALPTILFTILFIIRQIKFNSKRIHTTLPYKRSFVTFLYYIGIMVLFLSMPFAGNVGAFMKSNLVLNKQQYKQDRRTLNEGYVHFYKTKRALESYENEIEYNEEGEEVHTYSTYKYNRTKDSVIFYRDGFHYYYRETFDTVSIDQVKEEIRAFAEVAKRYGGLIKDMSAEEIIAHNCAAPKTYYRENYRKDYLAYNHVIQFEKFQNSVQFNEHFVEHRGPYFILEFEFWQFYLLVALGLAILLIILCSVKMADFGWAMLISALQPTVFGIFFALLMFGLSNFANDEEVIGTILLCIFTLVTIYIAFFSKFKATIRKAYAISLHVYIPILVPIFLNLIRELRDCCSPNSNIDYLHNCDCIEVFTYSQFDDYVLVTTVIASFVATYLFSRFYKKIYINPPMR